MKKQNANDRLAFRKATVTELNDQQLLGIQGGLTPFGAVAVASAVGGGFLTKLKLTVIFGGLGVAAAGAGVGYGIAYAIYK